MNRRHKIQYFLVHSVIILVGALVTVGSNSLEDEWFKAVGFALGTSIVAAGMCGLVVWVYIANSEGSLDLLKALEKSGLEWVYPKRAAQIRNEYAVRLQKAHRQIDILGFGLKDFKRDYMNDLGELSNRATIRILVLDPKSSFAAQRDSEENQSEGVIEAEVQEFISGFRTRYGDDRDGLQLHKYRSLPEVNIFRIDNEIFWGPYLVERASGNTPTMRVRQGGYMFDALESHFERIWSDFSESA